MSYNTLDWYPNTIKDKFIGLMFKPCHNGTNSINFEKIMKSGWKTL